MKLLIAILSLASSTAFAITTTTQTLTPGVGQSEFKLGVGYRSASAEAKDGGTTDSKGPSVPASYYYGFADNQAFGVEISYSSLDRDYKGISSRSSTNSGLSDIFVGYKGNFEIGTPTLFVRGGLNAPPEKMKANYDNGDNNNSSGQLSLTGSVGLTAPVSMFNLGVIGVYQANQEGDAEITWSGQTFTGKEKGGSNYTLGVYGEIPNAYHPNLSIGYSHSYTSSFSVSNNASILNGSTPGIEALNTIFTLRFDLTPGFELTPGLSYTTMLNKDKMNISKLDIFLIAVEGRLLF